MKTYTLSGSEVEDSQKTIIISEQVTETKENKITVAQLAQEYKSITDQITSLQARRAEIISEAKTAAEQVGLSLSKLKENPDIALILK